MTTEYVCVICGYTSGVRAEFVEFKDPVKLPKVVEKAVARGRKNVSVEEVKYICIRCSTEMYLEEVKPPKLTRITCPKCGEVIEVWL